MNKRKITSIIIHCAATPNGRWHNVEEIDQWHQARGFHRSEQFRQHHNPHLHAIGYHFVIYPNGALASGRHVNEVGAHAKGYNSKSVGVCLLGTDQFTVEQWTTLREHVLILQKTYTPQNQGRPLRVVGHRDLPDVQKDCPGFDVPSWLVNNMDIPPNRLLPEEWEYESP